MPPLPARNWRCRSVYSSVKAAALLDDDRGAEQMEYLLIFAAIVLPMAVAARLLWAVLLHYFGIAAFVIDLPLF